MNTLWHRLLVKLLEQVLTPVQVTVLSELPATSNPPQIDVLLLRREGDQWTPEQRAVLPDGVRDRNAAHHLLECKITESVTELSFQQALTYDYLYRQSQQLPINALQTYIVSAHTPRSDKLAAWGYTQSEQSGVYVSTAPLLSKVVLLILNQLRDEPHNEYLRLFASRQRVRETAFQHFGQTESDAIWTVVLALQRAYALEGAAMNLDVTVESLLAVGEEMRKKIVASASLKDLDENLRRKIVANTSPDELDEILRKKIVASASPDELDEILRKKIVASASPTERLAGLAPEERLVGLEPTEMQTLLQQIDHYLGRQTSHPATAINIALQEDRRMLLRVLRRKFGDLPEAVVKRVEAAHNVEQLTGWLDQALDATTVDAIDFDK